MKACCQQPAHRERLEAPREDISVERCRVCGCLHREIVIDPVRIAIVLPTGGGEPGR